MSDLKAFKNKRASLKANLKRFIKLFESIENLEPSDATVVELELRLSKIEDLLSKFLDVQLDIEALDSNFDIPDKENFEKAFYAGVAKVKQFIISNTAQKISNSNSSSERNMDNSNNSSQEHSSGASPVRNKINVRLSLIELPKFSSQYERWLQFRDLYLSLIHNCTELEPIQKIHYLRAFLEGSAAQCIKSIYSIKL